MKRKLTLSLLAIAAALFLFAGCGEKENAATTSGASGIEAAAKADDGTKRYPLRGVVVEVDAANNTLLVEHEEIPDFMPAMTMLFPVEAAAAAAAKPGQTITGTLVYEGSDYRLEDVKVVGASAPAAK